MTRTTFIPATSVNALVAAWLQFMIRDWFSHGAGPDGQPLGDPARRRTTTGPSDPMLILRTHGRPDPAAAAPTRPADVINDETHWWDGSQIYGTSREEQALVRAGDDGKLRVDADGHRCRCPDDPARDPTPGARASGSGSAMLQHAVRARAQRDLRHARKADYPTGTTRSSSSAPG